MMHLSTRNRQIEQAKQLDLPKKDFERKIAKNIKSDSKSFYKYVRSKTRVKSTVGPFIDNQGNLVAGDHDMSEMLNTFFASVFTEEDKDTLPRVKKVFCREDNEKLCTFFITSDMVKSKFSKIKMNKAPGIDLVGTRILIELSEVISDYVAELYNKTSQTCDIPDDWKLANVTPVFKKGKKKLAHLIIDLLV